MPRPLSLLCGILAAATLAAQTASLTGRVTDSSGGALPGARVSVTSAASGAETGTETNEQGLYSLAALPPGAYNVTVTKTGFETLRRTALELADRKSVV